VAALRTATDAPKIGQGNRICRIAPWSTAFYGLTVQAHPGGTYRLTTASGGKWETVASQFYRWRQAGVWEQVLETLQAAAHADGDLDWQTHYVDSTVSPMSSQAAFEPVIGIRASEAPTA